MSAEPGQASRLAERFFPDQKPGRRVGKSLVMAKREGFIYGYLEGAEDEREEIEHFVEVDYKLSVLLDNLTGGKLSKTNYDVRTMIQQIEQYFADIHERDRREESTVLTDSEWIAERERIGQVIHEEIVRLSRANAIEINVYSPGIEMEKRLATVAMGAFGFTRTSEPGGGT